MRLEKASIKAIRYACLNFHYSKSVPVNPFAFSVFNNKDEFCGVIVYSAGANNNIGKPYNLSNGQIIELTRMALNGKQESTSKALAISMKLLPKYMPLVRLIISFADTKQNHIGVIYQATNYFYIETVKTTPDYFYKGRWMHQRQVNSLLGSLLRLPKDTPRRKGHDKIRYIYPLDSKLIPLCKSLSKPYPKKQAELPHKGEDDSHQNQGAFDSTVPLKNIELTSNG